jgi:hypothetical protein
MGGCRSPGRSKEIALSLGNVRKSYAPMRRPFATDADGRLSLCKGEGEGEGLVGAGTEIEPLTFVLSPCVRGEAGMEN